MGRVLRTPLLVPSFSSKGFAFGRDEDGNIVSEAGYLLRTASEFLSDSVLVSAFDVHHGHIPPLARPITSITILDSGGYETSDVQDLSALRVDAASSLPWDIETYRNFLADWPDEIPSIVVSYDDKRDRKSIPLQIEAARELFTVVRGRQLTTFLIKPERAEHEFLDMDSVIAQVKHDCGSRSMRGVFVLRSMYSVA
jgi:hypothetical protein